MVPVGETALSFNGIITLNDTGVFLWECLRKEISASELLAELVNEFDVEPELARLDIQEFLDDALRFGLVEITTE